MKCMKLQSWKKVQVSIKSIILYKFYFKDFSVFFKPIFYYFVKMLSSFLDKPQTNKSYSFWPGFHQPTQWSIFKILKQMTVKYRKPFLHCHADFTWKFVTMKLLVYQKLPTCLLFPVNTMKSVVKPHLIIFFI